MTSELPEILPAPPQHPWRGEGLGWLALTILIVMTWMPESYYRMVSWPWVLTWQVGFFSVGLWLVWMLRQFNHPFRRLGYGLDWMIALTGVCLLLSSLLAPFRTVAVWNSVLVISYGALLYSLRNAIQQSAIGIGPLWSGMALTGVVTTGISLALWQPSPEMLTSNNFITAIRNANPFGHHNFVGGYLVLILPIVLSFALAQPGWKRWLGLLLSSVVVIAVYISGSRGAALGLLVWLVVTLAARVGRSKGVQRQRMLVISLILLALISLGMLSNPRTRALLTGLVQMNETPSVQLVADSPTRDRYFMSWIGRNILRDRPFWGVGPGNMSRVSNLYRPIESGGGLDHIQQLHNTPIQIAGEFGLWGLGLYLGWIGTVGRLWWQLSRHLPPGRDLTLLYGIGGSFLAYGVSSLTDYQLENVGISTILVLNIVLLIGLADRYPGKRHQKQSGILPQISRRWISLGVIGGLTLCLRLWLPFDGALWLGRQALVNAHRGEVISADATWSQAAALSPWDPTHHVLAGQFLLNLMQASQDSDNRAQLKPLILDHFRKALVAAPNDIWFNQNLGVLLLDEQPDQAEIYAARTTQLLPRSDAHTYYLLGLAYLAQQKREQAITAFTLEALINPNILISPLWAKDPQLEAVLPEVVDATLYHLGDLVATTPPTTPGYAILYEQTVFLQWWYRRPLLDPLNLQGLRPITQALLQAEENPQAAIALVNRAIEAQGGQDASLELLRAWLDPGTYAESYLHNATVNTEERRVARQHLEQSRDLRGWITSLPGSFAEQERSSVAFAYRNFDASFIKLILQPPHLETYTLLDLLPLIQPWPREFTPIDYRLEAIKTQELDLPSSAENGFKLVPLPSS